LCAGDRRLLHPRADLVEPHGQGRARSGTTVRPHGGSAPCRKSARADRRVRRRLGPHRRDAARDGPAADARRARPPTPRARGSGDPHTASWSVGRPGYAWALVRRPAVLTALVAFALGVSASASAYPWPVKPFHTQHPIRANFGDPRTRFWNTMLTDGLEGPGLFQFHNGIDIAAEEGTPVYPVVSGTARLIDGAAVVVRSPGRKFQYFHIHPAI